MNCESEDLDARIYRIVREVLAAERQRIEDAKPDCEALYHFASPLKITATAYSDIPTMAVVDWDHFRLPLACRFKAGHSGSHDALQVFISRDGPLYARWDDDGLHYYHRGPASDIIEDEQ